MIPTFLARAMPLAFLLAAVPLWALAATAMPVLDVGVTLPTPEFDELKQTAAESFEDFTGRVVLVEFFEYW